MTPAPILKPCPFCRSTAMTIRVEGCGHGESWPVVRCPCGASMEGSYHLAEVVALWNRRDAEPEPLPPHGCDGC